MAYQVRINKKFSYVRVYTVKKSLKGQSNALSRYVESFLQKHFSKDQIQDRDVAK